MGGNPVDWLAQQLENYGKWTKEIKQTAREKKDHQAKYALYMSSKKDTSNSGSGGGSGSSNSSGGGSSGGSSGSSSGSSGSTGKTTSTGKVIIEDVTAEAIKTNKDKEKVVNKANKYKEYWTDGVGDHYINQNEQRVTDDTPEFHIYISFEKLGGEGIQKSLTTVKEEEDTEEKKDEGDT